MRETATDLKNLLQFPTMFSSSDYPHKRRLFGPAVHADQPAPFEVD
jgi:hypothetical protein